MIHQCKTRLNLFSRKIIPRTHDSQSISSHPLALVASQKICESISKICPASSCNNRNLYQNQMMMMMNPREVLVQIHLVLSQNQSSQALVKVIGRRERDDTRNRGDVEKLKGAPQVFRFSISRTVKKLHLYAKNQSLMVVS